MSRRRAASPTGWAIPTARSATAWATCVKTGRWATPISASCRPACASSTTCSWRSRAQLRQESNIEVLAGKTFENFLSEGINPDPEIRASLRFAYERCQAFANQPERWLLLTGT